MKLVLAKSIQVSPSQVAIRKFRVGTQELLDVYLAPLSKAGLPPLSLQEDEEVGRFLGKHGEKMGFCIFCFFFYRFLFS